MNTPSIKSSLCFGFIYEGTFRQAKIHKNCNRDSAWLGIIDKDWTILKQSFQIWLNPENLDSSGRQKNILKEIRRKLDR